MRRGFELVLGGVLAMTIFSMMVVTFVDVVGRYFFASPLPAADEFTMIAMGVAIFTGLPLVTASRGHITISLFDAAMSRRAQRYRDTVVDLTALVVVGTLTWRLWRLGIDFTRYDDKTLYLGVPLAPVAYFMAMMSGLTLVVLLSQVLNRFARVHRSADE